jgi:hypothetical protein
MTGKCDRPNEYVETSSISVTTLVSVAGLLLPHPFGDRESLQTQVLGKFEQEIAKVENGSKPGRGSITGWKLNPAPWTYQLYLSTHEPGSF